MLQLQSLFYAGPSFDALCAGYAQKGRIDDKAPVNARGEVTINAPIEKVWEVLIDLPTWPHFDSSFSDVTLESDVSVGARASFRLNGFPIQGVFAVVDVNRDMKSMVCSRKPSRRLSPHSIILAPPG